MLGIQRVDAIAGVFARACAIALSTHKPCCVEVVPGGGKKARGMGMMMITMSSMATRSKGTWKIKCSSQHSSQPVTLAFQSKQQIGQSMHTKMASLQRGR